MTISSILFICLGNICRSPLAEGVFRDRAIKKGVDDRLIIDSTGTGGWGVGQPPDPRSIETAARHGMDISNQYCRRLTTSDFHDFDLILGMDNSNITNARAINRDNGTAKISLFTEWAKPGTGNRANIDNIEIPDPYYGGPDGFETAYQMIKQASIGSLERLF